MNGRRSNKVSSRLEAVFLFAGLLILLVFFYMKSQQEQLRAAGVAQVYSAGDPVLGEIPEPESATPGSSGNLALPDQALWSEIRVREYEASLQHEAGPALAVLLIDRLGIEVPVYDGADEFNMNRGVGRIRGTAVVGEAGNLGIAGHRDGFFRGLKDVAEGDQIELHSSGYQKTYRVDSIQVVEPSEVSVLAPGSTDSITLVTCYPFYFVGHAPQRFIVKASIVPES